jgi:hypothetical protein
LVADFKRAIGFAARLGELLAGFSCGNFSADQRSGRTRDSGQ